MKLLILIIAFVCNLSTIAEADEIENIVKKISQLTSQSCTPDTLVDKNRPIQVAFLRGSLIDAFNAPQAGEDYLQVTKDVLQSQGYNVRTLSAHHTGWQKICDSFKVSPNSRVVLVGHSYGSSGAMKVANCLAENKIKTELLINVSSFDFLAGVDVATIPEHVQNHINFWVTDPLIPGYKNHTAMNPEVTNLENIEAKVVALSPHIQAVGKLLPVLGLVTSAQMFGSSSSISLGSVISNRQVTDNLDTVWDCEQPQSLTQNDAEADNDNSSDSDED